MSRYQALCPECREPFRDRLTYVAARNSPLRQCLNCHTTVLTEDLVPAADLRRVRSHELVSSAPSQAAPAASVAASVSFSGTASEYAIPNVRVTAHGNTLVVVVGHDASTGGSVAYVQRDGNGLQYTATFLSLVGTQVSDDGTLALSTFVAPNQPGYSGQVVVGMNNTTPSLVAVSTEVANVSLTNPVASSASSTDVSNVPTVVSLADTPRDTTNVLSFLLVSGAAFAGGSEPLVPTNTSLIASGSSGSALALYAYSTPLTEIQPYGLAATLQNTRTWVGASYALA